MRMLPICALAISAGVCVAAETVLEGFDNGRCRKWSLSQSPPDGSSLRSSNPRLHASALEALNAAASRQAGPVFADGESFVLRFDSRGDAKTADAPSFGLYCIYWDRGAKDMQCAVDTGLQVQGYRFERIASPNWPFEVNYRCAGAPSVCQVPGLYSAPNEVGPTSELHGRAEQAFRRKCRDSGKRGRSS